MLFENTTTLRRDATALRFCIALKYFTFYNLFNELPPPVRIRTEIAVVLEQRKIARRRRRGLPAIFFIRKSSAGE